MRQGSEGMTRDSFDRIRTELLSLKREQRVYFLTRAAHLECYLQRVLGPHRSQLVAICIHFNTDKECRSDLKIGRGR